MVYGENEGEERVIRVAFDGIRRIDLMRDEGDKAWVGCLINGNYVNSYHLTDLSFPTKRVFLSKQLDIEDINCIYGDRFRVVAITDSNHHISTFSSESGELWYNLLTGSKTIVPKSFIAKDGFKNFHILKVTRSSIIGVIGNMFREYSFTYSDPKEKGKL